MLTLIVLIFVTYLLFRTSPVQNFVSEKVANYLSQELKAQITVEGVDVRLFKTVVLEELYIEDQRKETLLKAKEFSLSISSFDLDKGKFKIGSLGLINGEFNLKRHEGDSGTNMQFILDYFKTEKDSTKPKKKFVFEVRATEIYNSKFTYRNFTREKSKNKLDFNDLNVQKINGLIENTIIDGKRITSNITRFDFEEKSGFILSKLKAQVLIDSGIINLANLNLITPHSEIKDYFKMTFDSWTDFDDYVRLVSNEANFVKSTISGIDLAYFAKQIKTKENISLDGEVKGKISRLRGKGMRISAGKSTKILGDFRINGLPILSETFIDFKMDEIISDTRELEKLINAFVVGSNPINFPPKIKELGVVRFTGRYTGFVNDFVANGKFNTSVGQVISDINLKIPSEGIPKYSGNIEFFNLNIGKLSGSKYLGRTSFKGTLSGQGATLKTVKANLKANIQSITINDYDYNNVKLNGEFNKQLFNGEVLINDKNINLDFLGSIDFNKTLPQFNFSAKIEKTNLKALNLTKDSAIISSTIVTNFFGDNIDDLQGKIKIDSTTFTNERGEYLVNSLEVRSSDLPNNTKRLVILSEIGDLDLEGQYNLRTLVQSVKQTINTYAPSLEWMPKSPVKAQDFRFTFNLNNPDIITSIFLPKLKVDNKGTFNGRFSTYENKLEVSGSLDQITYGDLVFNKVIIDEENNGILAINLACEEMLFKDSINIKNIVISNIISDDFLTFNVKLSNKGDANQLDLNGEIAFKDTISKLSILPSEIQVNYHKWKIKDRFNIIFGQGQTFVNNFALTKGEEALIVQGIISDNLSDRIQVDIQNFNLTNLNSIAEKFNFSIGGKVNGNAVVYGLAGKSILHSSLLVSDLVYKSDTIGDALLKSNWDRNRSIIEFSGAITNEKLRTVDIVGTLKTDRDEDNLDARILLDQTNLSLFEVPLSAVLSDVSGTAVARLDVSGSLNKPEVTGNLQLDNVSAKVNYLNTTYTFSDAFIFDKNQISISNVNIYDIYGNRAVANGKVLHDFFKNFRLNIDINAYDFQCLNTTKKENTLYYGNAIASGNFAFNGPLSDIEIKITATTEKGTKMFIPLSEESSVGQQDFIEFVGTVLDSTRGMDNYQTDLKGIILNMDLAVTRDAEIQLIFDEQAGDIMRGRGTGSIKLIINTLGDFEMFGTYNVDEGDYLFTLEEVVKKKFKVQEGGTITWSGSPYDANLNIDAYYTLRRVPTGDLYAATGDSLRAAADQKETVNCIMKLSNSLLNPDINFGLEFPENQYLNNLFTNQDEINTQVFSLLAFNRFFLQNDFTALAGVKSGVSSTGTELLSNQLNLWLSRFDLNNLNLNLTSLQNLGASYSLFDDRVVIDGSFSSNADSVQRESQFAGDLSVEYLISKDGRFRVKAFNRSNNNSLFVNPNTDLNVQGLGLFYRIEFENLRDLYNVITKPSAQNRPNQVGIPEEQEPIKTEENK